MKTKGSKIMRAAGKRKKIDASKVRVRDLDPKKGKVAGGGFGGFQGGLTGITKK